MSKNTNRKRFIWWVLVGAFFAMLLVISMNYLIDPYDYFGHNLFSEFSKNKVAKNRQMRLVKARLIEESQPERIVLGTSRAMAFPSGFSSNDKRFVNLALAGSGVQEHFAYLVFANQTHDLEEVLYALDFFSFHASLKEQPGYKEARLDPNKPDHFGKYLKSDLLEMLVSMNATVASLDTIKANFGRDASEIHETSKPVDTASVKRSHFESMEIRFLKDLWFYPPINEYLLTSETNDTLKSFRSMCLYLAENNIETNFFISPIHVRLQLAMLAAGLRDEYREWVYGVTGILDEMKARNPMWRVSLWNFGGVNPITTEPVPEDYGEMRNYIDSSHFTNRIADLIYQTISTRAQIVDDFGEELLTSSVSDVLDREKNDLNRFIENNPADWIEILELNERAEGARMRFGFN